MSPEGGRGERDGMTDLRKWSRRADPGTPECREVVLDVPTDLGVIEDVVADLVEHARACDFSGSRLTLNFRVGLTEALANAMLYGNGHDPHKRVRIEVSIEPTCISTCVIDQGTGFDPAGVPDPTLPDNLQRPGGRGVFLIRNLMDEVEYNEQGNAVRLVLYRDRPMRRASGE